MIGCFIAWGLSLSITFSTFLLSYMVILNIIKKKRFGISYFILRILLMDLGILLMILMKSYIPKTKWGGGGGGGGGGGVDFVNTSIMHDFVEFINSCHLLKLESFGLPFTWFDKRSDSSSIFEKLDRVLIKEQWMYSCKDARVENLPIIGFDHGPIILYLDKRNFEIKTKTFRCEEFWFHILGFSDVVREAWSTHFVGSNAFELVKKI